MNYFVVLCPGGAPSNREQKGSQEPLFEDFSAALKFPPFPAALTARVEEASSCELFFVLCPGGAPSNREQKGSRNLCLRTFQRL